MTEKPLFTYLLGAGASANKLPVIENFVMALENMHELFSSGTFRLGKGKFKRNSSETRTQLEVQEEFLKDLQWTITETTKHSSVDTFAKKLFLTDQTSKLKKLKSVLSVYFIIEQGFNGIDLRYDSFFASLLKERGKHLALPSDIRILSWNYDYQVELAMSAFLYQDDFDAVEEFLQVLPREKAGNQDDRKFSLIKLNGTAAGNIGDRPKYNRLIF